MQLAKQIWKRIRGTTRFTRPIEGSGGFHSPALYRTRRGGNQTSAQRAQQIRSRELNPNDSTFGGAVA